MTEPLVPGPLFHRAYAHVSTGWPDPELSEPADRTVQSAATALIVRALFGGALLQSTFGGAAHYWNRLDDGRDVDLCRGTIAPGEVQGPVSFAAVEQVEHVAGSAYDRLVSAIVARFSGESSPGAEPEGTEAPALHADLEEPGLPDRHGHVEELPVPLAHGVADDEESTASEEAADESDAAAVEQPDDDDLPALLRGW